MWSYTGQFSLCRVFLIVTIPSTWLPVPLKYSHLAPNLMRECTSIKMNVGHIIPLSRCWGYFVTKLGPCVPSQLSFFVPLLINLFSFFDFNDYLCNTMFYKHCRWCTQCILVFICILEPHKTQVFTRKREKDCWNEPWEKSLILSVWTLPAERGSHTSQSGWLCLIG